jgi:hypothetical protein
MFDPVTAAFLRTAPALPDLDPATLPQTLTTRYAELVARRLRTEGGGSPEPVSDAGDWPLTRIADAYELITSIEADPDVRRAAAFVAATAQQILAQESVIDSSQAEPIINRDRVDPTLAAAILFLAAEQYADANEAAGRVRIAEGRQEYAATLLAEDIRDLAAGNLGSILERADRRPARFAARQGLEARGTTALFASLLAGIELFAAEVLGEEAPVNAAGRFDTAVTAFSRVLELSSNTYNSGDQAVGLLLTTYPGPRHLSALLRSACEATAQAAVTKIEPPPGVDEQFWKSWLRHRAATAPFMWRNHREAIKKGFHIPGTSTVMVLPTGAGKTTVSCIKIASVLASGKSVIFIAPTHALVEQLAVDLQEVFPEKLLGSLVSSDFDRLFAGGTTLRRIEVMTPEHCLALLSYAPQGFADVGLMVFDECHLLSPVSGLRRALDGMFCVLAFNSIAPTADFLFLSAMVRNGGELAEWIASLTGRDCVFVDPLWKPSRQARGVVFYEGETIARIRRAAMVTQGQRDAVQGKRAKTLRAAAKAELVAEPFALFGLQHNWLHETTTDSTIAAISGSPVELNGELWDSNVVLKPNVNEVAAHIATACVRNGLKTIVFVNAKLFAVSTARTIARKLGTTLLPTEDEAERWRALEAELGGLVHSLLPGPSSAVPHNSQMFRLERDLAERMFRRSDGAQVIVATPTLAQGLNLPAHIAILASDMRADAEHGGREALGAHEILNAAARAGRAGHLANGVVLLIPEEILTFAGDKPLTPKAVEKLRSILPEDDRCLELSDPLQTILDRISTAPTADPDVEYALNRLSTAVAPEGADTEATTRFSVQRSFGAFMAAKRNATDVFNDQITRLNEILGERNTGAEDPALLELAAQSGAPITVLRALRERLAASAGKLPPTIPDWVSWIFQWLKEDDHSRLSLLGRERGTILGSIGRKVDSALSPQAMEVLLPGVLAWLRGKPVTEIERALGGDPTAKLECPRARRLITGVIPLGFTFIAGLVAGTAREIPEVASGTATPRSVIETLPTAVRRGFDTPAKLAFIEEKKGFLSRVQAHRAYNREFPKGVEIDNSDDYSAVVALVRFLL